MISLFMLGACVQEDPIEDSLDEIAEEILEEAEELEEQADELAELPEQQAEDSEEEEDFSILGKRKMSLQWIEKTPAGTIEFVDKGGAIMVKGEQLSDAHAGDYLKIEGSLISANEKTIIMDATIKTKIYHINDGEECSREGRFKFIVAGKRKYWRLVQMDNPCDGVVDYVDIYL